MKLFRVLLIGFLFLISCNNSKSSNDKVVQSPTSTVSTGAQNSENKVETKISVEEKYAEIEPTEKQSKPALEPRKEIEKTIEKVTTRSGTQPIEKKKVTPPANPAATTEVVEKVTPQKAADTKAVTPPSKPAYQPVPIKEETVEDVVVDKPSKVVEKKKPAPAQLSHQPFSQLLSTHVSASGKVNYKGLKAQSSELDEYLNALTAADINTMSKKEKLAFWINAYNAFTIKKILNAYPVGSITDLDGGKPWDTKWIKLDGKTLSLNNIENDIIRPQFNEPRIHFAVNCAAKSCPPLLNKAWTAVNLESNFNKQTKAFVNNPAFNKLGAKSCSVSKIFEWYAVDFGDLITFLNKYSSITIDKGAELNYMEYDWSLNQ